MVHAGAITGGMLPKLEACVRALDGDVSSVRIMPASRVEMLEHAGGLLREGTEVVRS
jgi:acetylglutamate kinase